MISSSLLRQPEASRWRLTTHSSVQSIRPCVRAGESAMARSSGRTGCSSVWPSRLVRFRSHEALLQKSELTNGVCKSTDGNREGGPPFSVSEEAYDAALGGDFECVPDCSLHVTALLMFDPRAARSTPNSRQSSQKDALPVATACSCTSARANKEWGESVSVHLPESTMCNLFSYEGDMSVRYNMRQSGACFMPWWTRAGRCRRSAARPAG